MQDLKKKLIHIFGTVLTAKQTKKRINEIRLNVISNTVAVIVSIIK